MKTIILTISSLMLISCSFTGKYATDKQTFDWTTNISIPVEMFKK